MADRYYGARTKPVVLFVIIMFSFPVWPCHPWFSVLQFAQADPDRPQDSGPRWQRLPDMPQAIILPAVSLAATRLVATGGVSLGGGVTDAVQVLDLHLMRWALPIRLADPRYGHGQVTLQDGRVLVVGGRGPTEEGPASALASAELIDADLSRSILTEPLPTSMATPTVHLLSSGRVMAIGDSVASMFDPAAGSWIQTIKLQEFRRDHASVLLDGDSVLVAGGTGKSSLEWIDPARAVSHRLAVRLPMSLDDLALLRLPDGRVWLLGGQQLGGDTVDRTWILDPRLGSASDRPALIDGPRLGVPDGIADHVVIETSAGAVLVGGESEVRGRDSELAVALWLDPQTLTVRRLPDTDVAHDDAAGVAVDGAAIVLGGVARVPWLGMEVPTPVRAVHRLDWPQAD